MSQPDKPPWVNHYHFILPDPGEGRILLLPPNVPHSTSHEPEGYALPNVSMTGVWLSNAKRIADALRAEYALDFPFTILRYIAATVDEDMNENERWNRLLFVLEPHQRIIDPPLGGEWIDHAALRDLPLAFPEQRAPLLAYLEERAQGDDSHRVHPRRPPWARPGWFAEAARWIEQAVAEAGHTLTGAVEQLRNWSISTLLVAETTAGRVYFKAAADAPLFVNEPALLQTLADIFSDRVPRLLKIDRERRWMLMHDFGPPLSDSPDSGKRHAIRDAIQYYGILQRVSALETRELIAASCIDRTLPVLAAQIDELFADPLTQANLDPADLDALIAFAPILKQRCVEVAASNVPNALLHGDLHMGNIARRPEGEVGYLYFDWTDAAIGFPFLDHFLLYFHESSAEMDEIELEERTHYLAAWRGYEPPERLLELWRLAKPLCALHHAVSYLYLVRSLEPHTQHELLHGLTDHLQNLLAALRAETSERG